MSFLPDSEMHKLHSRQYPNAPPTPDHVHDSTFTNIHTATRSHIPIDTNPLAWESDKTRGLGLLPATSFGPSPVSAFAPTESSTIPFAWSAFVPSQAHAQDVPEFRREMWVDTPASATVSTGTWSSIPLSSIEIAPSDVFDQSEYGTSCTTSTYSSPYSTYALVEEYHTPVIKLESPFEARHSHSPPTCQYEQPGVVNPQDLVTQAPPTTPQVIFTPLLTPLTPRPTECRVASPQLVKMEPDSEGFSPERIRRKRGFTTPEDATCSCKQCGKLFRRVSNLAAHMQTHDEHRDHPWACKYDDCDKRFNRRTDMERHAKSVHIKDMSFRCQACDRRFGRKDTLNRHELAGCPRRKIIGQRITKKKGRVGSLRNNCRESLSPEPILQLMAPPSQHYRSYPFHS